MKSIEELRKIRDNAQAEIRLRESNAGTKVTVGMGTCGIAAGARDVLTAIMDEVSKRGLADVIVTQTGCVGLCEKEPIVEVHTPGTGKVTYGKVTPEVAREIITKHVVNGQMVGEHVISHQQ